MKYFVNCEELYSVDVASGDNPPAVSFFLCQRKNLSVIWVNMWLIQGQSGRWQKPVLTSLGVGADPISGAGLGVGFGYWVSWCRDRVGGSPL